MQVRVSEAGSAEQIGSEVLREIRELGVPIETNGHSRDFFRNVELIVPSPGVPPELPVLTEARERGVTVAGELALAAGRIHSPVIAVTGSNGKTTVTSLIGHLLHKDQRRVFVGGNIGIPVLDYLRGPQDAEVVVLELSSFQLEIGGAFRPDIGLLLNLSPDHIDRHGSLDRYADAKRLIFANQGKDDTAIIGLDDPLVMSKEISTAGRVIRFGQDPAAEALVTKEGVLIRGRVSGDDDELYNLSATALSSLVNRLNAAAAILAARVSGCAPESIRAGLADYRPPPHRMSLVAEIDGVRYINDSKGTNVGAVAAALASSGERVILIAGGRDKNSDFSQLRDQVQKQVRLLILIGEAAERIEEHLRDAAPVLRAADMQEAVEKAAQFAVAGDTVLLSPACASFDMFTSYAHRGEVFRQAVLGLRKVRHYCT